MILSGIQMQGERCFFIVADKLLPFVSDRACLLAVLNHLNRGALSGVHQLIELSCGVIYLYKQLICLPGDLSFALLDQLLEDGIAQFGGGLRRFRRELASGLSAPGESGESDLRAERN